MPNYIARQIQCAPQQLVLVACDRDQHIKRHMTQARKDYYLQGARRFDFVVDRAGVLGDEDMEMMDVDA